jgi:hypothetical protein
MNLTELVSFILVMMCNVLQRCVMAVVLNRGRRHYDQQILYTRQ